MRDDALLQNYVYFGRIEAATYTYELAEETGMAHAVVARRVVSQRFLAEIERPILLAAL
jgi:hypothetical protein